MSSTQVRLRCLGWWLAFALVFARTVGADPCPEGESRVGDLGFRQLSCDCTVSLAQGRAIWRFREEPRIGGIVAGGPADGKLEDGDVLVAVDGLLITTRGGASRLAAPRPGARMVLTVRREGRPRDVRILAGSVCSGEALGAALTPPPRRSARRGAPKIWSWSSTPAPSAVARPVEVADPELPDVPDAPEPPDAPEAPEPPSPPVMASRGWFGMGFNCDCGIHSHGDSLVWEFDGLPEIYYVDARSPAEKAGLRRGDVLTLIDGISLLSEEGGRRLGSVRPGQAVRWTFRRGGETLSAIAVAKARPGSEAAQSLLKLKNDLRLMREQNRMSDLHRELAQLETRVGEQSRMVERASRQAADAARQRLRYTGTVGTSEVEVRGLGTVVVTTESPTGEIVITTADATIHVRPAATPRPKQHRTLRPR